MRGSDEAARSRWGPRALLAAILVFAAVVRLWNVAWDQNHSFHPDERAVAFAVQRLSLWPPRLDPEFFAYGSLPIYLVKLTTSLLSVVNPEASGYGSVILTGRRLSAVFGTLTVLLIIILGTRLYDRSVGLLAGFLLAACVLHIQNSRFLAVDVLLTMFVLLALMQLIKASQNGRIRDFMLAGACIGLAIATKFSAMPLFLPLFVAGVARSASERRFLSVAGRLLVAVLTAFAAFAVAEPYALIGFDRFRHDILEQGSMVCHAGDFPYTTQYMHTPRYLYNLEQLVLWGMAPALGLIAIWATVARVGTSVLERRWEELILLSWVVPTFLVTGAFEVKLPRYLLPLYPMMILWASDWLLSGYRAGSRVSRIALPVVVSCTLAAAFAFWSVSTRPHTVVTASEWVYRFIPSGSRLLSQHWDEGFPLPLPGQSPDRYKVVPFGYYDRPDSPAKIRNLAHELETADFIVFQTKRLYGAVTRAPERYPLTCHYFYQLFAGDLGYTLVHEVAARPSLLGIEIPDELGDETLTVYDHPKVVIFKNTGRLNAATLADKILRKIPPSKPLSRDDLLLARPAGKEGGFSSSEASPIESSIHAFILFALLVEVLGLAIHPILAFWLEGVATYALSKVLGVFVFAYASWALVSLGLVPFTRGTLTLVSGVFVLVGVLTWRRRGVAVVRLPELLRIEVVFWGVFALFLIVRLYNPAVHWGEKPMDFSFLNAITRTVSLPPPEPWFSGSPLSYTYFGYFLVAALGKTLHLKTALTFNLGIALFAALTAAAAFAVGAVIGRKRHVGALAAGFVTVLGNLASVPELLARRTVDFHYFWATSRVIPETVNEFPSWSFLFADLHSHVMVMPVSLCFAALSVLWVRSTIVALRTPRPPGHCAALLFFLSFLLGTIAVTSAWSTPIALGLFVFLLATTWIVDGDHYGWSSFIRGSFTRVAMPAIAVAGGAFFLYRPFWANFVPPERNIGWERVGHVLPHHFLTIFGFFLFVLVPFLYVLWMRTLRNRETGWTCWRSGMLVLGVAAPLAALRVSTLRFLVVLFLLALWILLSRRIDRRWRMPIAFAAFSFAVIAGTELVYVWDRMNTIFKFYLEAWLLLATASAAVVPALWTGALCLSRLRILWQVGLVVLAVVGLFTTGSGAYAVIHTHRVNTPMPTLDGMAYLTLQAPDELAAFDWLNRHIRGIPVLLEAHGEFYQDFTRVSMNTGLPTVLGWAYHVYQRSHTWADINQRKADIAAAYTCDNSTRVAEILRRYHVALVFVGALERRTYAGANLDRFLKWSDLLTPVYRNPKVTIFAVNGQFAGTMPVTTIEEIPTVGREEVRPPGAPGRLDQPRGVSVSPDGSVCVADFGNHRVQVFAPDLRFLRGWGSLGDQPGQFRQPGAVAVGPHGEIYVADTWNHRVQMFSKEGILSREWTSSFFGPRGIAVDRKGRVFVADTGNSRVVRFSADGKKEIEWGGQGSGPAQLQEPVGLTVDGSGTVYVADNGNGRLQIFSSEGVVTGRFPVPGWQGKVFSEPHVAIDGKGTIWVTVPSAKEVRAYDASGRLLRTLTGRHIPGVVFDTPMGIAYSASRRELVVSDLEHRIVRVPLGE